VSGPPETSPGAAPGQPTVPPLPNGSAPWTYPPPAGYGTGLPPSGLPAEPARRRVRLWPPTRPEWLTALVAIAALAAVGAAVAPLWVHLAPRLAFRVDQPGRALPVVPEAEEYVAADGRFVLITLVVGVVAAAGCWLVRRSRGPLVLLALAAGGLLGAVITWRLGMRIGTGYRPADLRQVGKVVYQPLTLRAKSALVVEPVAAVIAYLLAVGFSARNDLGQDPTAPPPPTPPSYGSPATPPGPSAGATGTAPAGPGPGSPGWDTAGRDSPEQDRPGQDSPAAGCGPASSGSG
jgi:hypothetical protein